MVSCRPISVEVLQNNMLATVRNARHVAMTDRFLTRHELAKLYGISTRTVDDWRSRGMLPEPSLTPSGRPRWLESVARAAIGSVAAQATPSSRVA